MDAKPCRFASVFQIVVTLKLSPVETGMFRLQRGFKKTKLRLLLFKIHLTPSFELIWKEELSQLQTLIDFQWKIVPFFIWDYAYKNSWQVQQIK